LVEAKNLIRLISPIPIRAGEESRLLFTRNEVKIPSNGRPMGSVENRRFAVVILATFIGLEPPTARLKGELLGFVGEHTSQFTWVTTA
jgi:hypothetical protein